MKLMPWSEKGFALPTIVIASIVMLTVMLSAIEAATSLILNIHEQYYNQLASEAAESGANYAIACMQANSLTTPWDTAGKQLTPNTDCNGNTLTGVDSTIFTDSHLQTVFVVDDATTNSSVTRLSVTGTVDLLNESGSIWKTYTNHLFRNVTTSTLIAETSASGRYEVCGIISAAVWCWGHDELGQLGDGTTNDSAVPVKVARVTGGLKGHTDVNVAVGDGNACAVSSGEVYCWGKNNYGQLGIGTTDANPHSLPVKVSESSGLAGKIATQVVTNGATNCALASGDVYCWGKNDYGVIGNNTTMMTTTPTMVSVIGKTNGLPVTKIALTPVANHICAIASQRAYCWGDNTYGQLGDNTTNEHHVPTPVYTGGVIGGKDIVDIATDGAWAVDASQPASNPDSHVRAHSCVVTSDGGVYCWGTNQYGQLGQGTTSLTPTLQPVKVNGALNGVTATRVAVSYGTSCALAQNVVYCWGFNGNGQVGDGTTTNRPSATPVVVASPGLAGKTISDISGGVNRACVVAGLSSYCWGTNSDGQLGDGTYIDRHVPTEATFLRQPPSVISY